MNAREKQVFKKAVLETYNSVMPKLYKEFSYNNTTAELRISFLQIINSHVLSKTSEIIRKRAKRSSIRKQFKKENKTLTYKQAEDMVF